MSIRAPRRSLPPSASGSFKVEADRSEPPRLKQAGDKALLLRSRGDFVNELQLAGPTRAAFMPARTATLEHPLCTMRFGS